MAKLEALETNKPSSDNLPTKIIQEAKEVIYPYLTDSINATMDEYIWLFCSKTANNEINRTQCFEDSI